jgi:hypothetical protein
MAPSATETAPQTVPVPHPAKNADHHEHKPIGYKSSGALDHFEHFEVTPVIGREYPYANLVQWLKSENSDALLKGLALTSTFSTLVWALIPGNEYETRHRS